MTDRFMKRSLIVSVFLCISFILLVFLAGREARLPQLSVLTLSATEYETLKQGRIEDNSLMPENIRFDGCDLFYDADNARWFWSLSEDGNADVSVEVHGAKAAFREFELTAASVRAAQEIPFLLYTDSAYREFTLAVTTLPLLRIEERELVANNFDENTPTPTDAAAARLRGETDAPGEFRKRTDQPMTLTLWDNRAEASQKIVQHNGSIHLRGNGSSFYEKVGYRVTLDSEANLLGLRTDSNWILHAPYRDSDKIRNVFLTNLWTEACGTNNAFGVVNGNVYRWVELFLNDRYWGIYALGYPLDAKQLNLRDPETEFVAKIYNWTSPEIMEENPNDPAYSYELKGTFTDDQAATHYLKLRKVNAHWAAADAYTIRSETDIPNAIDIFLFTQFIQSHDQIHPDNGEFYNFFLSFKKTADGSVLLIFTPWDLDMTFGTHVGSLARWFTRYWDLSSDDNSYVMKYNPAAVLERTGDERITEMMCARWQELRAASLSDEAIDAAIEYHRAALWDSGAMLREQSKWPDAPYEGDELAYFKTYVHERLVSMDGIYQ